MKRPSFQFYPADWRKDPALSTCSLAARGLWIELMCVAHESDEYGILSINGKPMTTQQIARTVGESPSVVSKLLAEIEQSGVSSRTDNGCLFSRRMVKDDRIRNIRANAGRLGGNPNLLNQNDKQTDKQILTPSSSSSVHPISSSLRSEEIPPSPSGKKITFKTWLAAVKAAGGKPISTYRPVWAYAEKVGIDPEWVQIAWLKFAARYRDPNNARKKYIDWPRVFLNAVEGNWFGLWYAKDGKFILTTVGVQADIATQEAA